MTPEDEGTPDAPAGQAEVASDEDALSEDVSSEIVAGEDGQQSFPDRLERALNQMMAATEERLASASADDGAVSAADREREARTLATLARITEKLRELKRAEKPEAVPHSAIADEIASDTAATLAGQRAELEARLVRLLEGGQAQGLS